MHPGGLFWSYNRLSSGPKRQSYLTGTGEAPPIFFCLDKRKRAAPGVKENRSAQNGTLCLFCLKRGVPTSDIGQLKPDSALGAGTVLLKFAGAQPATYCFHAPGCKTDLVCFSFTVSRCGAPSISVTSVPLVPPSAAAPTTTRVARSEAAAPAGAYRSQPPVRAALRRR